jgi:hypothetical protein
VSIKALHGIEHASLADTEVATKENLRLMVERLEPLLVNPGIACSVQTVETN